MIIDVAVTGIDGQSRSSDEATERPLQTRYDQKMAKYGRIAVMRIKTQDKKRNLPISTSENLSCPNNYLRIEISRSVI